MSLKNGKLRVFDLEHTLLISAPRTENRLYLVKFGLASPVCLLAQIEDKSWLWHARFGHLNFRSLSNVSTKGLVDGMPTVKKVEKICDGCVLGKQHRIPFPQVSKFRVEKGLELVHADLCGQITPKTVGGASYFLLVVDDYSKYMWVEMLKTKDQALDRLKKIKLRTKMQSDNKLKSLRTDRGENLFPIYSQFFAMKVGSSTTPQLPILPNGME